MKKAIIDIGTNSTRLLIAEKDENGWRKVNAELNFTRIGENIGASVMGLRDDGGICGSFSHRGGPVRLARPGDHDM